MRGVGISVSIRRLFVKCDIKFQGVWVVQLYRILISNFGFSKLPDRKGARGRDEAADYQDI